MEVKFVKPKLSSTSSKEDLLFAINQMIEIDKEIIALKNINLDNYTEFIKEHRNIIKKNMPIVGKTYRFLGKDDKQNRLMDYHFIEIFDKIEYFYVNYVSLKSVIRFPYDFIPKVKCIPLDINGHPFEDKHGGFICVTDYDKGAEISIALLSVEDYPEMTKVFKKITSKKTEKDLQEYNRLKLKFG